MNLKLKAEIAAQKARELKRKANKKKIVNVKNVYFVYARGRKPIFVEAKDLVECLKWALKNIPKQDVLEIHDEKYKLLWGKNTGINKEIFNDKHSV
jgi:hypothetical protein